MTHTHKAVEDKWKPYRGSPLWKQAQKEALTQERKRVSEEIKSWKFSEGCSGSGIDCGSEKYNQALDEVLEVINREGKE